MRKIASHDVHGHVVNVYWNAETAEYVCRIPGRPASDYFTDDKDDANATALAMAAHKAKQAGGRFVDDTRSELNDWHAQMVAAEQSRQ